MLCSEPVSAFEQERQPKSMDRVGLEVQGLHVCSAIWSPVATPAAPLVRAFRALQIFLENMGYFYISLLAAT